MARRIVGVVVGVLIAGLVVALVEVLGMSLFPPGSDVDAAKLNPSTVPVGAVAMVGLAWALGPVAGGFVATLVGRPPGPVPAFAIGALFLVADIANLVTIPSPGWLWAVGLGAPMPCAWLGFALARGVIARRAVPSPS